MEGHFAAALVANDERGSGSSNLLLDLFLPGERHGNWISKEWREQWWRGEGGSGGKEEGSKRWLKRQQK